MIARESELDALRKEAEDQTTHLTKVLGKRDEQYAALLKENDKQKDLLRAAKKESDKAEEPEPQDYTIWWVIGGSAAAITLGTAVFFLLKRPTDGITPEAPDPASPAPAVEKSKSPTSEATNRCIETLRLSTLVASTPAGSGTT